MNHTEWHQNNRGDWTSTQEYGIPRQVRGTQVLRQLHVDSSGFYTPVGPSETIAEDDWKEYGFKTVSMWGKPSLKEKRLILGPSETTFPRDGKWIMQGDVENPFYLSELGVKRITKKLTAKITALARPKCEDKWNLRDTLP